MSRATGGVRQRPLITRSNKRRRHWLAGVPRPRKRVYPPMFRAVLRYEDDVLLPTAVITANAQYLFRTNSCFDPDFTGTGHQPYNFDQLCSATGPYNNYLVMASRLRVTFAPYPSQVGDSVIVGVGTLYNQQGSAVPGYPAIMENSQFRHRILPCIPGRTDNFVTLQNTWRCYEETFMAASAILDLRDTQYSAAYNADPALVSFHTIWASNQTAALSTIELHVSLALDVLFYEPTIFTGS